MKATYHGLNVCSWGEKGKEKKNLSSDFIPPLERVQRSLRRRRKIGAHNIFFFFSLSHPLLPSSALDSPSLGARTIQFQPDGGDPSSGLVRLEAAGLFTQRGENEGFLMTPHSDSLPVAPKASRQGPFQTRHNYSSSSHIILEYRQSVGGGWGAAARGLVDGGSPAMASR